jgi:glycosyltransferase involved in cell wall biosynthesis
MKMDQPSFSIVIPTYQRRELVCETVRSLAKLNYAGSVEMIVVADGCTDGTACAVAAVECPFPVHLIEQRNSGAGAARNRGTARSSGDIVLFLDDDMIAAPDILEQHASSYAAGADAVVGDFTEPGAESGVLSQIRACRRAAGRDDSLTAFDIFSGQISMRRAIFETLGGFDATPALTRMETLAISTSVSACSSVSTSAIILMR